LPESGLPAVASTPVLLVEDNDDLRAALARLLRLRGFCVIETRDGQEAWEYLESGGRASVIVLDLILPRMNGRIFRARLLEHDERARIPVIVFTAAEGEPLTDVAGFLRKTTRPEALLDMIADVVTPSLRDEK
jgi:CheY-like chemotaxis protein